MRLVLQLTIVSLCAGLAGLAAVQQPQDKPAAPPKSAGKDDPRSYDAKSIVERMMAFDTNKDGKLSRDEITDRRLRNIFELADADKDGVVTKEELTALSKRLSEGERGNDGPGRGFGPPGGPGRGGQGGPGRFGGPPQSGQVLPPFLQETLKLSAEQKKQLAELQKEIDSKLAKILSAEQKQQLKDMSERFRPGGPGGPPPSP